MNDQIKAFEAMLARGQDSEMLRLTLGNAYFSQEDFAKAVEHFTRATELKPDYSAAWKMLGRSLLADGQHASAVTVFDQAVKIAAENGDKQAEKEIAVFRKRALKAI